jgi:Flp pilus assembly protein TadD
LHFSGDLRRHHATGVRAAASWKLLTAAYDRLRRFDLADSAYRQTTKLIGSTPEIVDNQGYSYMPRRNYRLACAALLAARQIDQSACRLASATK